ncbi:MAG: hypothetical protein KGL59_09945 [Acidobacteriota bacterium]|nr:hypothetical protein [Acidobacteriota bacterium]
MSKTEKLTPIAAVLAAVATLACCLPIGFIGAAGLAGLSVWSARLRWWLVGGSLGLLALGFAQLYGKKRSCRRPSKTSAALLWIAVAMVLAILLFPQFAASLLAW